MDSLLERIEENKLDALYLFITEILRDRTELDRFLQNLFSVLPHNWSIQRVEVGHEFLSMVSSSSSSQRQEPLFSLICSLESLRGLIISDGYIPRKDDGLLNTDAFLTNLPRARNLQYLDVQRLRLQDSSQVELLAKAFECLQESIEEIRITGITLGDPKQRQQLSIGSASITDTTTTTPSTSATTATTIPSHPPLPSLDDAIQVCVEMSNLRSLAISCNISYTNSPLVSREVLLELCQNSTTLQDLSLRAMHLNDETCATIAQALTTNSFLTSLDIRQNPDITQHGYKTILASLERNYDLWCSVMVDNDSFQAKFDSLIELNQANRGDLVRSPTREKLMTFLERLQQDNPSDHPTSIWYFLTIHDSILHPLVEFLKFKSHREAEQLQKQHQQQQKAALVSPESDGNDYSKRVAVTALPLSVEEGSDDTTTTSTKRLKLT